MGLSSPLGLIWSISPDMIGLMSSFAGSPGTTLPPFPSPYLLTNPPPPRCRGDLPTTSPTTRAAVVWHDAFRGCSSSSCRKFLDAGHRSRPDLPCRFAIKLSRCPLPASSSIQALHQPLLLLSPRPRPRPRVRFPSFSSIGQCPSWITRPKSRLQTSDSLTSPFRLNSTTTLISTPPPFVSSPPPLCLLNSFWTPNAETFISILLSRPLPSHRAPIDNNVVFRRNSHQLRVQNFALETS